MELNFNHENLPLLSSVINNHFESGWMQVVSPAKAVLKNRSLLHSKAVKIFVSQNIKCSCEKSVCSIHKPRKSLRNCA